MRKRSSYRPKAVIQNPLAMLLPVDKARGAKVMTRFLSAIEAIASGSHPGHEEWRDLSDAINTIETLAIHMRKLREDEVMPTVNAAIAAMVRAANRYKAGHGMRIDGDGLSALRDVVDIYGQCVESMTEHEMAKAQAETLRRVNELIRHRQSELDVVSL